ncbi:ABC transporter ATP-binding protein [Neofamilia massiliensis]|uniref:ATP-binding cassette domain-containing protein n=1 Tax=Neofamilia massiliensis TaxID=1673724 RepID=UPI0006BB8C3B|nr:ABC transporter ATP-binding protein [Neofamilia massiliensis]
MKLLIENIHKSFGANDVLKGAEEVFQAGQIYALLGRNGSGKTTLFDIIAQKKKADDGQVLLEIDGEQRPLVQEDLFYMVANPLLPNFLTGREFLQFFIDVNKERVKENRSLDELFDWIDFDKFERDYLIQTYSLGTRNKLQMLMFLLIKPNVILMDEPLTSLDVVVQLQIKKLLKAMENDHIILFSTHILQLATDLCDQLVILSDGKLYKLPDEKLKDPNFEDEIIRILSKAGPKGKESDMAKVLAEDSQVSSRDIYEKGDDADV